MAARQLEEVIALQDHVVEFEEGERLLAVEPQLHRVEAQHAVDGEVHAIVAQEVDVVQVVQPVGVVGHQRVRRAIAELQELGEGLADARQVGGDLFHRQHLARLVLERRVADLGGAAAHQRNRLVAGLLHPAQHHDLHERTRVQGGGRGVEADIAGDPARLGLSVQRFGVRDLVDEPAL